MSRGESGPGDQDEATVADEEVLELAIHVAERSLDMDLQNVDHHHSEMDRSVRLGAASLGALLVVAGVFATVRFVPAPYHAILLSSAVALNLIAMLVWIFTKTGIRGPVETALGPDLYDLMDACKDPEWEVEGLQISLLEEYAKNGDINQQFLRTLTNGRRAGVILWVGALFFILVRHRIDPVRHVVRVNHDQ